MRGASILPVIGAWLRVDGGDGGLTAFGAPRAAFVVREGANYGSQGGSGFRRFPI
jgi:hypothetical protein